jgi:hypothetical protein
VNSGFPIGSSATDRGEPGILSAALAAVERPDAAAASKVRSRAEKLADKAVRIDI